MVKYVVYAGHGTQYLVTITKRRVNITDSPELLACFLVTKKDKLAVDDATFDLLKEQGHIGDEKLQEVQTNKQRPFVRSKSN